MFKTLYNDYHALDPAGPGDAVYDRIAKITNEILSTYPGYSIAEMESLMIGAIVHECSIARIIYGNKKKAQERESHLAELLAKRQVVPPGPHYPTDADMEELRTGPFR